MDIARNWHGILLGHFETFFRALKGPRDMAMYSTRMDADVVTLYFSPTTEGHAPSFIRFACAEVCDPPDEPLHFLAGHPDMQKEGTSGEI
ncbi:MAG: hypothetical protein WB646_19940 [Steroidobacteraceae bacterium]